MNNLHDSKNNHNCAANSNVHVHRDDKNDNNHVNVLVTVATNNIDSTSSLSSSSALASSSSNAAPVLIVTRPVEPKQKHSEPVLLPDPKSVTSILKKPKVKHTL